LAPAAGERCNGILLIQKPMARMAKKVEEQPLADGKKDQERGGSPPGGLLRPKALRRNSRLFLMRWFSESDNTLSGK